LSHCSCTSHTAPAVPAQLSHCSCMPAQLSHCSSSACTALTLLLHLSHCSCSACTALTLLL
ncbi:hypothetical protein NDU88_008911, partial [Pleurodeles waltl]